MNRLRFRSGQVQLVRVAVDAATVIEAGDLVWLDSGEAKPASDFEWDTNLATTQAAFAAAFLGVAQEPSAEGESSPISVDVSPSSVYEFVTAAASYDLGAALGPDEASSTLMNQQLEAAVAASAVARAAEASNGSTSLLRVSFASAFAAGSANVNAALG